jgi:VanZ family protein
MTVTRKRIGYWLPVIVWMGIVYAMSTDAFASKNTVVFLEPFLRFLMPQISPATVHLLHSLIRKSGHLAEYFILGLLLFRAFRGGSTEDWTWRWAMLAITVVVLYAISDEFHQLFVSTRTGSAFDVCIDAAGGIISQVVSVRRAKPQLSEAAIFSR